MNYTCPADGHSLKAVHVHKPSGQYATAHLCDHCGGVLLDEIAQAAVFSNVLKVDPKSTLPGERPSPSGKGPMKLMPLGAIALDVCEYTKSLWFDAGKMALVMGLIRGRPADDAAEPTAEAAGPSENLKIRCVDCGHPRPAKMDQFIDVGSGMLCHRCTQRTEATADAFKYRASEVQIQHQNEGPDYQCKVDVGLAFKSRISGKLRSPGLLKRLLWMIGLRSQALGRASLDQAVDVAAAELESLRSLLNIHGVPELLHELASIASYFEITLTAATLSVIARGWTPHPQNRRFPPKVRFESITRRLLDRLYALHSDHGDDLPVDTLDQWSPVEAD